VGLETAAMECCQRRRVIRQTGKRMESFNPDDERLYIDFGSIQTSDV
jgi:hypothetical protein